jgi:hypothetical protein
MWRAAVSQAVDQSSTRNKRNDRLAEGHDRVAGTDMVLRIHSDPAPLHAACHRCFCERRYFPKGDSLAGQPQFLPPARHPLTKKSIGTHPAAHCVRGFPHSVSFFAFKSRELSVQNS